MQIKHLKAPHLSVCLTLCDKVVDSVLHCSVCYLLPRSPTFLHGTWFPIMLSHVGMTLVVLIINDFYYFILNLPVISIHFSPDV